MAPMRALFLDRDGVLNVRPPGDYVKNPAEFVLLPGVAQALALLSPHFYPIVVVTNQAGIGKRLMTLEDLSEVHALLRTELTRAGGRVDAVYFCPHRADEGCDCRKPATGMAMQAKRDFPDLDFSLAYMVGDSASDMLFGQKLGMFTILIEGKTEDVGLLEKIPFTHRFDSLISFATRLVG